MSGVPVEEVMRMAGHLPPEPREETSVPGWLVKVFEPLNPPERKFLEETVQRTARELLLLREETAAYEAPQPSGPEDGEAPPPAPRENRSR
jgi:hypothetical protein